MATLRKVLHLLSAKTLCKSTVDIRITIAPNDQGRYISCKCTQFSIPSLKDFRIESPVNPKHHLTHRTGKTTVSGADVLAARLSYP